MVTESHTKWFIKGTFEYPSGLVKEETKHFWSKEQDSDAARGVYDSKVGSVVEIHSVTQEKDN